ncbi:MAG TPA: hypothetical protein VIR16_12725 [Candidatus Limnocylindrales bacterium]
MRHAEALEQLADLALEPGRLERLGDDPSPEAAALRRHLAGCASCSAELAAWRRTWAQVGAALADVATANAKVGEDDDARAMADIGDTAAAESLGAPAALRARTLGRVAAEGAVRTGLSTTPGVAPSQSRAAVGWAAAERVPSMQRSIAGARGASRQRRWAPWVVVAAALVVALGAGSLAWTRTRDLDRAQVENAGLTETMASLDRVLATPAHWTVTLRTPDGVDGGTMAWSGSEIAVITTALPGPAAGQSYRCWVERDGVRTPIGPMWFSGTTGYWAGAVGAWAPLLAPGSRVGVSLIPAGGGPAAPVLTGSL